MEKSYPVCTMENALSSTTKKFCTYKIYLVYNYFCHLIHVHFIQCCMCVCHMFIKALTYVFFANNYLISSLNRIENTVQYSINNQAGYSNLFIKSYCIKAQSKVVMFTVYVPDVLHQLHRVVTVSCIIPSLHCRSLADQDCPTPPRTNSDKNVMIVRKKSNSKHSRYYKIYTMSQISEPP